MLPIIVTSCGRTGTNIALEILRGHSFFKATEPEEDKVAFKRKTLNAHYLTKCDTAYYKYKDLQGLMNRVPQLRLIWTIRDPRDMAMSKFRRGVPKAEGGDCKGYAADSTIKGMMEDVEHMYTLWFKCQEEFSSRCMIVKMEMMLTDTEAVARKMCEFACIEYQPAMLTFWTRMRNKQKAERYKSIDLSQIAMWRSWRGAYDRWFTEKAIDMQAVFLKLYKYVKYFNYPQV